MIIFNVDLSQLKVNIEDMKNAMGEIRPSAMREVCIISFWFEKKKNEWIRL